MQVLWRDVVPLVPPEIVPEPEFGFAVSVQDRVHFFDATVVSAATPPPKDLQGFLPTSALLAVDGVLLHQFAIGPRTVSLFRSSCISGIRVAHSAAPVFLVTH